VVDSGSIVEFLGALKAKHVQVRGPWVQCSCPLAPWFHDTGKDSSPSFAIRIEPNKESWFNCFVCKFGSLGDLVVELQHLKAANLGYDLGAAWALVVKESEAKIEVHVKDWGEPVEIVEDLPIPEAWLVPFKPAWPVPYAREYLESRDVSEEIAHALDIRWDRSLGTVCFPVRNHEGELVSVRGRFIKPKPGSPPYHVYPYMGSARASAWLGEHSVDYDRPVLMVESVFDAASVMRVYDNILSPMTVGINYERMARVQKCVEVVTLFDQGTGGDKARAIVSKNLGTALVCHLYPTAKDPGEMSEKSLRDLLRLFLKLKPASV
jgi:hypothetical protein